MQEKVVDLGVVRIDDVAFIVEKVVQYYERSLAATNVILEDEADILVNANRRDMTKSYLVFACSMRNGLDDPDSRYSKMTAYDAAMHLASAAEWYGKCCEASNRAFRDREQTIKHIKAERKRKAERGYTTW